MPRPAQVGSTLIKAVRPARPPAPPATASRSADVKLIEQFLEAGTLVTLNEGFVEFDRHFYAVLTGKGRRKPLAHRCLAVFEQD